MVKASGSRISVVEMGVDDFYHFKAGNRARNTKKIELPLLSNVVEVHFVKGSRSLYYKCSHDTEEYTGVDFLRCKFSLQPLPDRQSISRGISSRKKEGILKILGHVDALRRKFFTDLRSNDAAEDLVTQVDL